jgi:hypothetical protein
MLSHSTLQQTAQPGKRLGLRDQNGLGQFNTTALRAQRQSIEAAL